jgi:uncharacterized protein YcsI (UPF0317 family)
MPIEQLIRILGDQESLDSVATPLQAAIRSLFASAGPAGREAKDFLHGSALGHPLHPALIALPVGAWTLAAILDALEMAGVHRDGELADTVADIRELWRDDLVAFVLGCSYSFDATLQGAKLPLRHLEVGLTPSVFITNVETVPAGPFSGPLVVSMRPFKIPDAIRAIELTARFPHAHGAPVHFGDPGAIGITDIGRPDWGGPIEVKEDEVPVFWACGVTPQAVIQRARLPICITHYPGCMLVTDLDA